MMDMLLVILLVSIHIIYLELQFEIEKGIIKRVITYSMLVFIVIASVYVHLDGLGFILMLFISFLFVLFYGENPFQIKLNYFLGNITILIISSLLGVIIYNKIDYILTNILFIGMNYLLILFLRKQKNIFVYLMQALFTMVCVCIYVISSQSFSLLLILVHISTFEYMNRINENDYEMNTKTFQSKVMMHHYEEVKTVYLNMRGWRHDYHNHIQTIKAYLQMDELQQVNDYLQELEEDLDKVDILVKSGNLMIDAILNSKLSLALSKNIRLHQTALVCERVSITDLDLCVILGNLLDNAIEACMKVEKEERFIRVYISILKQQLYISITNSANNELSFNDKNYISEKRGDHGHGMKRVKLTVDKYSGYLNVQNEPGVFVSEVMLPLVYES